MDWNWDPRIGVDWFPALTLTRVEFQLIIYPKAIAVSHSSTPEDRRHSTLHYKGVSIVRYAMKGQQRGAQERRREGGTRERGKGSRSGCFW
jgi:hypothetical protein